MAGLASRRTDPRWQLHLPADEGPCSPDLIFGLLQVDIECRVKAGLPALLAERYFEHPRLQREDARLDAEQERKLIRWEYQQRWDQDDPAQRAEYAVAFPQHADALRDLKPRWCCPRCRQMIVAEETNRTWRCSACEAESPRVADVPPSGAETPLSLDAREYQLVEPLGKGGMGEVYRACDPALGRDLAIKVVKSDYRGDAEVEQRFLREARVTGSLQHPGIVPVHNLGRLADGRLHYTMRLVRGQTLAAILKDEAGKAERLPYLLSIFEKVCQAVAYAHSKRVIHRDLKPANVMVGRFGEVQVMDWGLAKLLSPDEATASPEESSDDVGTVIHTESADTPPDVTRAGSGMGTPSYMSPEQAAGDWQVVDERADVFALGAILCEMLTSAPPYTGADGNELLRRARRGDLAEALARLEQGGADTALTALSRECLSPEREGRPGNAGVVARRVADYRAEVQERLRQAELERVQATVRAAEERKRRRLQGVLALAVLLAGAGAAGGWWWIESDRIARRSELQRQEQELRTTVLAILVEAEGHQSRSEWVESRIALERAEGQLGNSGHEDLRRRLIQARKDLELVRRLDEVRLLPAATAHLDFAKCGPAYADVLCWYGLDVLGLPPADAGRRVLDLPPSIRETVLTALFEWIIKTASQTEKSQLRQVLQVAEPDPSSLRRQLLAIGLDRAKLIPLARDIDVARTPPNLLINLSELLGGAGDEPEAVAFLRRAQLHHPTDFWINYVLALKHFWLPKPQPTEAIPYFTAALAIRPVPVAYYNLGVVLGGQGKYVEAEAAFRKAIELKPDYAEAYSSLGALLHNNQGKYAEAEAAFRKATDLKPDFAEAYFNLGNALNSQGKHAEAEAAYRKAIALKPDEGKAYQAYNNLGSALDSQGKHAEAEATYRKVIALKPDDAWAYSNLGTTLNDQRKYVEAERVCRKAIDLKPDLAGAHCNLGHALSQQGRFEEALACLRRGHEMGSKQSGWRYPSLQWVRIVESLIELEKKLPAILAGEASPANAREAFTLAWMCQLKKRPVAAARLYADAFIVDPKLVADLNAQHCYNAACSAALAAAGQGEDARLLPDKVVTMFRRWALGWLHDDLTAYAKLAEQNNPAANKTIQQRLTHWRRDPDLASVREAQALDRLADHERAAWQALWRDVDERAKRAANKDAAKK